VGFVYELIIVWVAAATGAAAYQFWRRRPIWTALHLAVIFAIFVMLVYFVGAIVTDVFDIRAEPEIKS
jgi:hypothetical protein